jgi:hypothetical protein
MEHVYSFAGTAGTTQRLVITDTASTLDTLASGILTSSTGRGAISALISVQDNAIRVGFGGAVPTQAGNKLGHQLTIGQMIVLDSGGTLKALQLINDVNGSAGVIQITPFFEFGG